jgi:predicted DNA-binding transcriptional regulator AlpA
MCLSVHSRKWVDHTIQGDTRCNAVDDSETSYTVEKPGQTLSISGVPYYSAAEVARAVGVSRQTLWRWRSAHRVPQGRRFRNGQVLFSEDEFAEIRAYATQLVPVTDSVS